MRVGSLGHRVNLVRLGFSAPHVRLVPQGVHPATRELRAVGAVSSRLLPMRPQLATVSMEHAALMASVRVTPDSHARIMEPIVPSVNQASS